MISSFISLGIVSAILLCFKQTQWLGFMGAAILGMIFPITTSVIGIVVGLGFYRFNHLRK